MSLRLYLLRHGETSASRDNLFCGALDPGLTPEGAHMAEDFAAAYRDHPWSAIYASPMRRTLATAAPLAAATGNPVQECEGLKEIAYGAWEGRTVADVQQADPERYLHWLAEPAWNAPTNGETGVQVAARASHVIAEITNAHPSGEVLVVSHKATIRLVLCSLLGIDVGRYRDRLALPTGSVSVVRFGEHGPMLESLGDRSHLRPELRGRPGT
jgi:probable phosphoglycerate mutase